MQFKVMKALGYNSLFDEGFRRELRNPFRRMMYYKVVSAEEGMDSLRLTNILKSTADRIGFLANPSDAHKILKQEQENKMQDPEYAKNMSTDGREKYESAIKEYQPPSAGALTQIKQILKEPHGHR